ncbi:hypothetical protein [Dyadobacter aurulentus]|uniref:hypothetical protein n=1 Tax=Dyadobacter sp. UC 10 TaxID=2605428 RepID=UPI0011F35D9B|nr:hypothetical protein [Dyadobacter sp. UC 10]KAA0993134.1 hypothetical protein FXO21_24645 [Dyadobacter sp. UC 10]
MEQTVLNLGSYIQISVGDEQKLEARELVEFSLRHHQVANVWDGKPGSLSSTRMLRFTGTLGEIVFADCYHLPRPTRSFGATGGQDWGQDFLIKSEDQDFSVDIKSMKRKSGVLSGSYVLNIPASQLHKTGSKTTHYFCISFHQSETEGTIASLLGFIDKTALETGELGHFHRAGTKRIRFDGSTFIFNEGTYEIEFCDIRPPVLTDYLRKQKGFRICQLN